MTTTATPQTITAPESSESRLQSYPVELLAVARAHGYASWVEGLRSFSACITPVPVPPGEVYGRSAIIDVTIEAEDGREMDEDARYRLLDLAETYFEGLL